MIGGQEDTIEDTALATASSTCSERRVEHLIAKDEANADK